MAASSVVQQLQPLLPKPWWDTHAEYNQSFKGFTTDVIHVNDTPNYIEKLTVFYPNFTFNIGDVVDW